MIKEWVMLKLASDQTHFRHHSIHLSPTLTPSTTLAMPSTKPQKKRILLETWQSSLNSKIDRIRSQLTPYKWRNTLSARIGVLSRIKRSALVRKEKSFRSNTKTSWLQKYHSTKASTKVRIKIATWTRASLGSVSSKIPSKSSKMEQAKPQVWRA